MTTPDEQKTTHKFQAEVTKVLSLVIHSLYSNPEVFLRELVSNASDALDKLRFRAVTDPSLLSEGEELKIRLIPDAEAKTLTIWDNGVGMNADALARELGTVAHSGTKSFLEKIEKAKRGDVNLIGQFGVGFYSAYLVADRVEVISRAAGESQAHRWTSEGAETFTIEPAERETHGTSIILHLKQDEGGEGPKTREYLEGYRLRTLVRRYSDFLDYPVELVTRDKDAKDGAEKVEKLNQGKALWEKRPSEVTKEQYEELYKHLTHDFEPPILHRHFHVEGTQLFTGLLYVPKKPPFDLFTPDSRHGVRLYVKRVFIMDDCQELLPRWLRFVRGIVDSDDLPLNVSREMLQDSKIVKVIRKQIVKQLLESFEELARDDSAKYADFWGAFGVVLKEGLHFEPEQKDRIAPLLRYESSKGEGLISLADYKSRMPEGQKAIYYVVGESRALAERSPHTESLKKRGFEVLYMTDPVDSFAVDGLDEYEGLPLVSATSSDLKLDDETEESKKEKEAQKADALKDLREHMRRKLQEHVSEVRVSDRLTDSPVCLVMPEGGLAPYMERLLRATQKNAPKTKRILEINPGHPLVQNLERLFEKDAESAKLGEWVELLFEQALLAEGSPVEDPVRFATRLTTLLQDASGAAVAAP